MAMQIRERLGHIAQTSLTVADNGSSVQIMKDQPAARGEAKAKNIGATFATFDTREGGQDT